MTLDRAVFTHILQSRVRTTLLREIGELEILEMEEAMAGLRDRYWDLR